MSHQETENIIVEKEKELKAMLANQNVVEQQKLNIQREILELQLKKKDVEIVIDKSKGLTKQIQIELSLLTKQFWSEKNRGE